MRTVRVTGASLTAGGADRVVVEGQFCKSGSPRTEVVITGLPDAIIRESRGRLLCALRETRLQRGGGRFFLNLVPAARPKSGEVLDLPLVLAGAGAVGHLDQEALGRTLFLGEVGIDGALHGVPGGLAAAMAARQAGLASLLAPPRTAREAAFVPGVEVLEATHLSQVIAHLSPEGQRLTPLDPPDLEPVGTRTGHLDVVRGQAVAKHALAVSAAGGHGLLMVGPPGAGKTLLARALLDLLPPPSIEERLDLAAALSASGRWPGGLPDRRPFRSPHHSTTHAGLVGGGNPLAAGEITLAHHGVLFLDELPEFRREVLEALRQPLEAGEVCLSRAGRQARLPARFQLVTAMNPCPCGQHGHPRLPCHCAPQTVRRYRQRISGPLLDRIDLRLEIPPTPLEALAPSTPCGPSPKEPDAKELLGMIEGAHRLRAERKQTGTNAHLLGDALDQFSPLQGEGRSLLAHAVERRGLSARAVQSLRRVARTLADLEEQERVMPEHLAGALALRAPID
ncbi:hypothetical protein CMO84_01940 [Candidatus Woesearchaeota archaeon]|nr:hypothetical protein [Candidatus Woesearchaeota archaeon]